ncbi:MAG: penicillin-binding protein 1C [Bacteroidetes bacterium GWF2_33_16]|nr:MAG: penicillin-binding protein 1C [Bacteroidetes bacterium GWE2_32_14]OFY04086.1 MAG: penicillin-binding protein 1C [Bacteroidetes bacterium GWF2_33_16]
MKKAIKWMGLGIVIGLLTYLIFPLPNPLFNTDYSLIIKDESGKMLRVFLNKNEQWCLPLEDSIPVPEKLKTAVITYEDQYFYWHPGVNPVSLVRAIYQNISEKRIVSGASTISMQVARLRKRESRSYSQKIKEMFLALKINLYYSKDEILDLYLHHAPYGGNIIGYRTASKRYFDKDPRELSWGEAATLAVLPNAPGMVSPSANKKQLQIKRDQLLQKLFNKKVIDKETYDLALLEPLPDREYRFKIVAPHLSQTIKNSNPKGKIITTTIDFELQDYLEQVTKQYVAFQRRQGIKNGAVLVVETKTGKVKAYVGSQGFFDAEGLGQVDGVMASRSSGSLLKPFLYALAIDEGIIIPQTLVKDVPSYFDAFSPNNADEKFNGIVTAKDALIRSLNVPAVRLLNTYGVYRFYSFLQNAGVSTLFRTAEDYGLPLIIGGAEINAWDISMLFRGMANRGSFSPNYYLVADSVTVNDKSPQLISSGACYLTLEMLNELKRPGAEYYWDQYQNQKPLAWKTGTSYGHKDAWAVGVSPQWTIAVWIGNFDGEGNKNLSGPGSAGPLLFDVFNYLKGDPTQKWFEKIEMDFKEVCICKETGFLAGDYCDDKDTVEVPIYMNPLRLCPFHYNVFLDTEEKYAVCSYCWEPGYHEKHYLLYPADVTYYLRLRGQIIEKIPEHNPLCDKRSGINPLEFLYPTDSALIQIPRDFDGQYQKIISKIAHQTPTKNVFWYLDDFYLGSTKENHSKAIELSKGWHEIIVIDEDGYKDKVKVFVRK